MSETAEAADETAEPTWLYRVYGDAEQLLYIGISNDFGRRWNQHAKTQLWWEEKRRLSADNLFDSRDEAEAAERAAIKAEKPKYNFTHNRPQLPERPNCYWYGGEWWRVVARESGWPDPAHRHVTIQSVSGDLVHAHVARLGAKHVCVKNVKQCRECGAASSAQHCECVYVCGSSMCGEPGSHRHHSCPCCEAGVACRMVTAQQRECAGCPEQLPWPAYELAPVVVAIPSGTGWPELPARRPRVYVEVSSPARVVSDSGLQVSVPERALIQQDH